MEGIVGSRQYVVGISEFNAWLNGCLAGLRYGRTMAEVDAHYDGLLREIKELQEKLRHQDTKPQSPPAAGVGNKQGVYNESN